MSLQFDVEEFIRPLVSALYESSDEDMEIDTVSTTVVNQSLDDDSDIEVLACYRETPVYPPQLTAGRAMTFDLPTGGEDQEYQQCGPSGSIGSIFDPSDSLIEWVIGSPPLQTYAEGDPNHRMANCSRIDPIPYSPLSPPLIDQGPSHRQFNTQPLEEREHENNWATNHHITGLTISASKLCGQANYVQHGDCTVCGKSYAMIQEEMTLGYLEQTHEPGEIYAQRMRRRDAFEAGMRAASVILVPGGVSQAAACDGIFYQIPGNSTLNPPPGVLPI